MKPKKDLQKLTELEIKINKIISLERITQQDLEQLNSEEKQQVQKILGERFNELQGVPKDEFFRKIEPIVTEETRNQLWEYNHSKITWAISNLMQEFGRMPSKEEIAIKAELSRQTVHKHLKEYLKHPLYKEHLEQFKFMSSKLLSKVYNLAVNGDMAAAKLFLTSTGFVHINQGTNRHQIQNQNNYIQINGMVISQESVKHLNPEQLNTIETIVKMALPKSVVL